MGSHTEIAWTESTWSPMRGCSRVSPGCERCYAEQIAGRFCKPGLPFHGFAVKGVQTGHHAKWTRKVSLMDDQLDTPISWREPRMIFVNSMSDTFHEALSVEDIVPVFAVMAATPRHTYQVLTKRADRFALLADPEFERKVADWVGEHHVFTRISPHARWTMPWPLRNVWVGASVEDRQRYDERVPLLRTANATLRFLSVEPLLEDLGEIDLTGIDWVIVGGESGSKARPLDLSWARTVRDQCTAAGPRYFFKQAGAHPIENGKRLRLRDRHGGDLEELPADLRIREMPHVR